MSNIKKIGLTFVAALCITSPAFSMNRINFGMNRMIRSLKVSKIYLSYFDNYMLGAKTTFICPNPTTDGHSHSFHTTSGLSYNKTSQFYIDPKSDINPIGLHKQFQQTIWKRTVNSVIQKYAENKRLIQDSTQLHATFSAIPKEKKLKAVAEIAREIRTILPMSELEPINYFCFIAYVLENNRDPFEEAEETLALLQNGDNQ